MEYFEYPPPAALADFVKCIWILEADETADGDFEKIFPDGTTELIFHFAAPFLNKKNESQCLQDRSFLYGQLTSFIEIKPTARTGVLGVRFKPFGLSAFTTLPQHYLLDNTFALRDIFHHHDAHIDEKIHACRNNTERIRLVESFLTRNLLSTHKPHNVKIIRALNHSVKGIRQLTGNGIVARIADEQNVSTRELERRFKEHIGLSPKQLIRISRFQDVLNKGMKHSNLTALAYDTGYYDQSHFIRDFKAFAGTTPAGFLRQKQELAEIFYDK